jgi:multidrug efflux system membrane fusion protein
MSAINQNSSLIFRRVAVLAVSSAMALTLAACKEETVVSETIRPVKVAAVEAADTDRQLSYSGSIQARIVSPIGFRVSGKILERRVEIGMRVHRGDVIATLDATDLRLQADSARAALAAARTGAAVANDALTRAQTLFKAGHIAQAALDSDQLSADNATRGVESAESTLYQAENQIAYTSLVAHADGVVTAVMAEPGQVVASGAPVIQLAHDNDKEVRIDVPEQDIAVMAIGAPVSVHLFADPTRAIAGTVREIAAAADPASRTFAVRIAIGAAPTTRLGMTADVSMSAPVRDAGLVVPLAAVAEHNGATTVWIADKLTSQVMPRRVTIDRFEESGVHVKAGLKPGDLVVVAGVQFLQPDQKVRLETQSLATAELMTSRP